MSKETIKSILEDMKEAIEAGEIHSPGWWLDGAQKLAVLRQDLQAELVKAEIQYRNEIVELQSQQELSDKKAENMVKGRKLKEGETMTAYELFNYLRTRDKVVEEIIRIAKKRATLEEYGD